MIKKSAKLSQQRHPNGLHRTRRTEAPDAMPRHWLVAADKEVFAPNSRRSPNAFTLIELILVMALLVIVIGVAIPSLKGFFHGRTLDSEAKRFLALTRYGQSRAVSEGLPMVLWIDPQEGDYGLQAAAGYLETDTNAVQFKVDKDLEMEVSRRREPAMPATRMQSDWNVSDSLKPVDLKRNFNIVSTIEFLPDGFITETSPEDVIFREDEDNAVWLSQSRNRLNYEIQTNTPPRRLR